MILEENVRQLSFFPLSMRVENGARITALSKKMIRLSKDKK
jgi:hypothetical protein